jgi:hypothetical protein
VRGGRLLAAMEMTLHRPGPHLSDCVAAMVHFSGFAPDYQREKLLPDGVMEIVVDLSDRPKRLFRDESSAAGEDFRKAWISGLHRRPIIIEAQPMAAMLVIAFTPGGALPFIGGAADALTDGVLGAARPACAIGCSKATHRKPCLPWPRAGYWNAAVARHGAID